MVPIIINLYLINHRIKKKYNENAVLKFTKKVNTLY